MVVDCRSMSSVNFAIPNRCSLGGWPANLRLKCCPVCHNSLGAKNMEVFKLRLKIGANEFEAEGSEEYVKSERQIFLESFAEAQDEKAEPGEDEKTPLAGGDTGGKAALNASG